MRDATKMGRPREFDETKALAQIMDVFWAKGFEGATLSDLVAATGLKKGSLYAAFGDKRAMYLKALALYEETAVDGALDLLQGPGSAKTRIASFLQAAIDGDAGRQERRGCFLCNASIDQAGQDPEAERAVKAAFGRLKRALADALSELAPYNRHNKRRDAAAQHLISVYIGLRVLAKAGYPPAALTQAKKAALREISGDA